jgi:PTH1 family peptidyl-tRNA hydrolase
MSSTKMIVGLGNPGPRYAGNRHNIGFQCIDLFAARYSINLPRMQMKARVGDGWIQQRTIPLPAIGAAPAQRQKVILVKPLTFMNLSGQAVGSLVRYYSIDLDDIIVVHDDLDLDAGILRLRRNGGSGGQNGIKSLIQHLGSPDFHRARVGIGRPHGRMDAAAYVLQDFSSAEEDIFGPLRQTIVDALAYWLFSGIDAAMNRYNG